ncbi:MAG: helix-turn-helix domain containing protein [Bacteroidales bacterium]|nr:helix-turn-helix domain containing protein [Bacteroidales bacterium]
MQKNLSKFSIFFLNRLKSELNIKTDTELARFLEIKQNTISGWRSRNTIDIKLIIEKCENYNISFDYLIYGNRPNQEPQKVGEAEEKYGNDNIEEEKSRDKKYIRSLEARIEELKDHINSLKNMRNSTPDTQEDKASLK